ncbi:proto-oncogene tyrosine-protein kinase ROS-like [Anoplolepis gracilipes]|uniref:proto-oncogene tyrosine-protein kinase ROS-like n=1 Tax=Anoplolepis gracilipes TaxID=354296 RepID=UPI003BA0CC50
MLKMLKTLCVSLKVLILIRLTIAISGNVEDDVTPTSPQDVSAFEINDHYMLSNVSSDSMTILNENDIFPSEPTFPRAFVDFGNRLNEKNISVTFRWNKPKFTNRVLQKYMIQYWFIENLKKIVHVANISATQRILQYKAYNLRSDTMYYFKVQAYNEAGAGPYTNFINVSTMQENPLPLLFIASLVDPLKVLDVDLRISFPLKKYKAHEIVYLELERKIYWISNKSELMTCDFDLNAIEVNNCTKITDIHHFPNNLCLDWVTRNLYWIEYIDRFTITKLDLALWQTGIVKDNTILQRNNTIAYLNVLPPTGYLYWLEFYLSIKPEKMQSDFNGKNIKPFLKNNSCSCAYKKTLERAIIMQVDYTNIDKPLMYWICQESKTYLIATDIYGCNCNLILTVQNNEMSFLYLTIDKINLYWYNNKTIYILEKKYALFKSKENKIKYVQKVGNLKTNVYNVIALSNSLQSHPPTKCLVPDIKEFQLNFLKQVTITTNSIVLNIQKSVPTNGCKKYKLPTTIYIISVRYQTCLNNDLDEFDEFYVKTHKRLYEIQNLTPFTTYTLKFALTNLYVDKLSMKLQFGEDIILKTTPGKLNAPENVTVQVLTPTLAVVYWMPPKNINCVAVTYEVHWMSHLFPNGTRKTITQKEYDIHLINQSERTTDGKFFMSSHQLVPRQEYLVFVRIYSVNFSNLFIDSLKKSVYMYPEPNNLILSKSSINSINISWNLNNNITHYTLKYKQNQMQIWQIANNTETDNYTVKYHIGNLLPGTLYKFRLILRYCNYEEEFIWPSDGEFTFETHEIFATHYNLIIISTIAGLTIGVYCICHLYYSYRKWKESNNEQVSPSTMTNIELATLDEIPQTENIQSKAMYASRLQFNRNELTLTIVEKKQITLTKLVGRGAFGKVFQGTVKDLEEPGPMPVAIKMLRSNASSQQITEFFREAKFMSHSRHPHVLRLLGICMDADSPWLILELMETDLLEYLRESRTLDPLDSQALRLQDLLAMCEDVARGCCYLEKLHFVHRDLACRNCLITSRNRENRIVKIGDFGLARDIYKDQYYRKRGEGFLPVRWMAPESLVDGIFTSQSDVWAFGVLMWEIMSLGEQPYPAKSNDQVLEYVRSGGKLPKPLNCPPTLYELMQHCWNVANDRPNFVFCLNNIVSLRNSTEDATLAQLMLSEMEK